MDQAILNNEKQNNLDEQELEVLKQQQSEYLTQKQTDLNSDQAFDSKIEDIYKQQDIMSQVYNDKLYQDQLNCNKQNQINTQIIQQDKQQIGKSNQIQTLLQNFEESLNNEYSNVIQSRKSQKLLDSDKLNDNISGSDFEKKCQIRNDLRQVSKQMSEGSMNQKLTSQQFFNQDRSFLFKKSNVSQKAQDININNNNNNNNNLENNIMNSNPFQTVNVGLSKVALKNKLNPSMLKKFQNVGEQQEDYLIQLFDESPKNKERQTFNFADKNIEKPIQDQIKNEEIKQFILNGQITKNFQQSEQQKLIRKTLENQIINLLQDLKNSNNQKLMQLLSSIDDEEDDDNDLDYRIQIRQKYLLQ
ncbi:hypothetical protein ABPG74_015161 [Tetrahymena malaccensis]